ncbi:hypothetical protein KUCAC02_012098 [Chaenocephalus aceratus]|uniref:Uncharacterized protein n=1 Tax=Chaenocephalus aceratus TaxID=36190 RepID=A0ACB9XAG2_CHAAC|nr:hypothetical protein KUCAC02_012098 [Chaenocephalus aceratus]
MLAKLRGKSSRLHRCSLLRRPRTLGGWDLLWQYGELASGRLTRRAANYLLASACLSFDVSRATPLLETLISQLLQPASYESESIVQHGCYYQFEYTWDCAAFVCVLCRLPPNQEQIVFEVLVIRRWG